MKPSDRAWLALAAYVFIYNLSSPEGEMLSEACDRYLIKRPLLTRFVTLAVSLHLTNLIPEKFDIIHMMFLVSAKAKGRLRVR